jgi:hypothetical protein
MPIIKQLECAVALEVIPFLIYDSACRDAVVRIIKNSRERYDVVEATLSLLLDEDHRGRKRNFITHEDVLFALKVVDLATLYKPPKKKVVRAAAEFGFYGLFPELPRRLLERDPEPCEIVALVAAYIKNTATQSDSTEDDLAHLCEKFLPREDAVREIARLKQFHEDYFS